MKENKISQETARATEEKENREALPPQEDQQNKSSNDSDLIEDKANNKDNEESDITTTHDGGKTRREGNKIGSDIKIEKSIKTKYLQGILQKQNDNGDMTYPPNPRERGQHKKMRSKSSKLHKGIRRKEKGQSSMMPRDKETLKIYKAIHSFLVNTRMLDLGRKNSQQKQNMKAKAPKQSNNLKAKAPMNNVKTKNGVHNTISKSQKRKSLHKYGNKNTSRGMVKPGRTYQGKGVRTTKRHGKNSYTKVPSKEYAIPMHKSATNDVKESIPLQNVVERMAQPQMQIHSVPVTVEQYESDNNNAEFIGD